MKNNYEYLRPDPFSESLNAYIERVSRFLSNFPAQIISQWLYDHFDSVLQRFSWLDFSSLLFKIEPWNKDDIIAKIKPWNEMAVESWTKLFISDLDFQMNPLCQYMKEKMTWPVPPIIFNNSQKITEPDGSMIPAWQLVEGHHRFAYFRGLFISERLQMPQEHDLWIMSLYEESTST